MINKKIRRALFYICLVFAVSVIGFHCYQIVFAEQSGSSPESGADSRLTTMATAIASLNYGSTAAGSWGDWGTALNRVYSAAQGPFNDARAVGTKNGTGGTPGAHDCSTTFGLDCYTQALGGVEDLNNNVIKPPADTYRKTWTTCDVGNSYCGTGDTVNALKQDPNTGLVWSASTAGVNWFNANNCKYPNGLPGDDGTCDSNGDIACYCVKHTGGGDSKTGCEALGAGWRLPYQKELMQAYIDGILANFTASDYYWSSTTRSDYTAYAWRLFIGTGWSDYTAKTSTFSYRCVH